MNFTKKGYFTLAGKRYKILSAVCYDNRFDRYGQDIGNCVEMIEVRQQTEMGETIEVEVRPMELPGTGLNETVHNDYVRICGTKVYPKAFLYDLIEKKQLILE